MTKRLLTIGRDAKTKKGEKQGYLTGVLYLAPSTASGLADLCPYASAGCKAACLASAGRMGLQMSQDARQRRTQHFIQDREDFMARLADEIAALRDRAWRRGLQPAVRLNGTSDLPWENINIGEAPNIMALFPEVTFYDYTKNPNRKNLPDNYSLTFSLAEDNDERARQAIDAGMNVAIVLHTRRSQPIPQGRIHTTTGQATWLPHLPIIDGDQNDLRFLDPQGVYIGLRAKGDAVGDDSGFVRRVTP